MKAYNLDATLKVENDEQWEAMQDAFTAFLEALTAAGVMHEAYLSLPEPFLIPVGAPDGPITPADVNTGGTVRFDLSPEEQTGRMSDAIAEQAMKIERSKCCGATILRSDVDPTNAVCATCYGDVS